MDPEEMNGATLAVFDALDKPFPREQLRQRPGGNGITLDYIDVTTAIRRMDEALGKDNWGFETGEPHPWGDTQQGYVVCTGKMTVTFPNGKTVIKGQMGGCAFGQGGRGMTFEDAAKGAASDAFKKCASLFGVALDLSEKTPQQGNGYGGGQGYGQTQQSGNNGYSAPPANNGGGFTQSQASQGGDQGGALTCEDCGEYLTPTNFRDGTTWLPQQLATFGQRKHGKTLCMREYREYNQKKRQAEESLQQVPF